MNTRTIKAIVYSLVIIVLASFSACKEFNEEDTFPELESKVDIVTQEDIPEIISFLNQTLNSSKQETRFSANQVLTSIGVIDMSNIMEVIDTLENRNYTFLVSDDDNDPFTFTNLIIKKREEGSLDYPYLLEYEVDSARRADFVSNGFRMDAFSGTVKKRYLDASIGSNSSSVANLSSRSEITPGEGECDRDFEYDNGQGGSGGGGTSTGDNDEGNDFGGGGSSLICWDVMEPVEVPVSCETKVSSVTGGNVTETYDGCYYDYNEHKFKPIGAGTKTVYVLRRRCEYIRTSSVADDSMCPVEEPDDHGILNNGLDEYIDNPPLFASASEQKHFLSLVALELNKYPETQEASLSIYESLGVPLSLTELRELVARSSNIYQKLRQTGFSIDRLNTFNQEVLATDLAYVNLFPEIKKQILDNEIPLSTQEWEAMWEIFKPLLAELLIETIPGGGLTLAFRDIIEGSKNADAIVITGGIVALIVEAFPPGKVAKAVWRVGKIVRKGFKFVK